MDGLDVPHDGLATSHALTGAESGLAGVNGD